MPYPPASVQSEVLSECGTLVEVHPLWAHVDLAMNIVTTHFVSFEFLVAYRAV
jgi:hypothetical protein